MKKVLSIGGWILSILFFVLFVITLFLGKILPALPLLFAGLIVLPPFGRIFKKKGLRVAMVAVRILAVAVLLFAFIILSFIHSAGQPLYNSEELKSELYRIYDAKMDQWPVPHEIRNVRTAYGRVHVIVSGPEDGPPVLLLHAASMGAWSWLYNVAALSGPFRTYAVDYIGEPGKSVLDDINRLPMDGKDLSDLYSQIADELGITGSYDLVGASYGGYIALCHALHAPERVGKVALLGPMGITPATSSTSIKLVLYSLFPLKIFQNLMLSWALGEDPEVLADTEDWFRPILRGVTRKGAPPLTFKAEELREVKASVLLILGDRDKLVGDPEKVRPLAENVPGIRIEILPSAHLIGAERSVESNALLLRFLKN